MRFFILALFAFLASVNITYACQCPTAPIQDVRKNSLKNSDLIFIGRILEADTTTGTYRIQVLEVFKGQPKEILVSYRTDDPTGCAFWPSVYWGFEFIFYANSVKGTDDRISVDSCSATRSISNPQMHLSYFIGKYEKMQGILYREMTFDEKIKFLNTDNKLRQIAFKDLIEELRFLRKLKEKN